MNTQTAILLIEISTAITMIAFGIHQFIKPEAWIKYIPNWLSKIDPLSDKKTMQLHAALNILIGLFLVFDFGFSTLAAWIAFLWWLSIVPFAFRVDWTVALRDLVITLSLLAAIFLI